MLIAMVCGLILTFGKRIEDLSYQTYLQNLRINAAIDLSTIREKFEAQMVDRVLRLNQLASALAANPDMNQTEFNIKAVDFLLQSNDVINIAAAPDLVVEMVFPKTGNETVLGLNYRNHPKQYAKVREALRSRRGQIDGPVQLVQGGRGLILRQPVFARQGTSSAEEPWGIVSVVLDYDSFINSISSDHLTAQYDIVLRERRPDNRPGTELLLGEVAALSRDPVVMTVNVPLGVWELAATPIDGWPKHRPMYLWHWFLRVLFASLVGFGLFYVLRLADNRRRAESRLTNGIEALPHGFVMFNPEGELVAMNKRYAEMHGASSVVRLGVHYEDIVKSSLSKGIIRSAIGREEEWLEEWRNRPLDGSLDPEQVLPNGRIIQTSDRLMDDGSVVGLRIDITDLKRAQQAAEAANKAKTDFMGVLSHELRTPLTVILGHARLARHIDRLPPAKALEDALAAHPEAAQEIKPLLDALTSQVTGMMARLERSGDHLLSLISEILDFAKLESGSQTLQCETRNIDDIVGPVEDQMRPMIEEKGLHFNVKADTGDIHADPSRIRQVLINLVGNASKFTKEGGIDLTVKVGDDEVEFSVKDSGIGIPEDQVNRVFEAFHQVDSTSTRQFGGTGLGLAISRDIAEAHGGTLTASSVPGEGSTFVLRLPRTAHDATVDNSDDTRRNLVA
ncbi:ATP-binding protein [Sulfitobacter sp. THAF37]|uniref:ATP-binding protein n=1 Tax=Sulfitobacter sp. THAF37 TaxID=2587855 RepID=UPI00156262D1|nr:ATP-binding protein [Sulfitobacter sp. THAF37]